MGTLADITESTLINDVSPPPVLEKTDWIKQVLYHGITGRAIMEQKTTKLCAPSPILQLL
jgi:hypothetical protein